VLSGRSLDAFLRRYGRRGRTGVGGLRAYLDARGLDYTPPASGLEGRAMELFDEAGIEMVRQVDSGNHERWTGRVDFRHPTLPLVIEIQSERYHSSLCDQVADAARRDAFEAAGYEFLELTDTDIWSRPGHVVSLVRDAIARTQARRLR
jgi:very-short-patch-repair endonuclease